MKHCANLFYFSTIACRLAECLSEQELAELAADLVTMSDMLANIITAERLTIPQTPDFLSLYPQDPLPYINCAKSGARITVRIPDTAMANPLMAPSTSPNSMALAVPMAWALAP